jgi:hypothetical protein
LGKDDVSASHGSRPLLVQVRFTSLQPARHRREVPDRAE